MTRRTFLESVAAGAVAARGVSLDAFAPQGTRQLRTLGLQLYTVRDAMAKRVVTTESIVALPVAKLFHQCDVMLEHVMAEPLVNELAKSGVVRSVGVLSVPMPFSGLFEQEGPRELHERL